MSVKDIILLTVTQNGHEVSMRAETWDYAHFEEAYRNTRTKTHLFSYPVGKSFSIKSPVDFDALGRSPVIFVVDTNYLKMSAVDRSSIFEHVKARFEQYLKMEKRQ